MWYEVTLESSVTVTVEAENEEQAAQRAKDAVGDFDIQNAFEDGVVCEFSSYEEAVEYGITFVVERLLED